MGIRKLGGRRETSSYTLVTCLSLFWKMVITTEWNNTLPYSYQDFLGKFSIKLFTCETTEKHRNICLLLWWILVSICFLLRKRSNYHHSTSHNKLTGLNKRHYVTHTDRPLWDRNVHAHTADCLSSLQSSDFLCRVLEMTRGDSEVPQRLDLKHHLNHAKGHVLTGLSLARKGLCIRTACLTPTLTLPHKASFTAHYPGSLGHADVSGLQTNQCCNKQATVTFMTGTRKSHRVTFLLNSVFNRSKLSHQHVKILQKE